MTPQPPGPHFGYMHPAPPAFGYVQGPTAVGPLLDMPVHGAPLPPLCCKCGTRGGLAHRDVPLVWVNPLAYLGLLGGILPLLILVAVLQKRARLVLPICAECSRRWSLGTVYRYLAVAAPFVLGPAIGWLSSFFTGDAGDAIVVGLVAFLVLLVVVPISVVKLVSEPRAVRAVKIDDHRIKLRGVSPEMLRALQP